MGLLQVTSALKETPVYDEPTHLAAGWAYLHGDYRFNTEHPPLAKILFALPLLPLDPILPVESRGWKVTGEDQMGDNFLYKNRYPPGTLLMLGRGAAVLLTLLFGLVLAWWMRQRFGAPAAVIALGFYCLDPNIIAHGRYVTTDVPLTLLYFVTCIAWAEYLLSGRKRDLWLSALLFSLAQAVKFSALVLIPVLALLYGIRWWQVPREFPPRRAAAAFAAVAGTCVIVLALVYGPETLRCFQPGYQPLIERIERRTPVGDVLYRLGDRFHLPAHPYIVGWGDLAWHNHDGHPSYLLGMLSQKGWWYYFPVAFGVKSSVAALLALIVVLAAAPKLRAAPFVWIALAAPPLVYFLSSMASSLNLGVRHILPVYPFLYAGAAAILAQLRRRRAGAVLACGLVVLQAAECASIYPHYLAFFNFVSGGPENGPRYLADSNIDWGQDVKKLAAYLRTQGTNKVRIIYFGKADLSYYGLQWSDLPEDPKGQSEIDDFAAASVTPLCGVYVGKEHLRWLREKAPAAKVGYSIYVYDLRKSRR